MQIEDPIRQQLGPGEQVLWSGRPLPGLSLQPADLMVIPFSLVWTAFAVYWTWSSYSAGAPLVFQLFGACFITAGLCMVGGRFVLGAFWRARTHYAITTQRVLIVVDGRSRTATSLPLRQINGVTLTERRDGSGDITLGGLPANDTDRLLAQSGRGRTLGVGLTRVPGVRAVHDTLLRAQAAAAG